MTEAGTPASKPMQTVEGYLAAAPDDARRMLEEMRGTIRAAAPEAVESISYGVIGYKLHGRPLVYIGAAKKHCALYAITTSVQEVFSAELAPYGKSKGTIRFPLGQPLPAALIEKIVRMRRAEVER